jgi:hypothetical protein
LKTAAAAMALMASMETAQAGDGNGYGVSTSANAGSVSTYRMGQDSSFNYTRSGDTPQVKSNYCDSFSSATIACIGGAGGTTNSSYDLTSSLSTASVMFTPVGHQYSAQAYANLATGKVGASTFAEYHGGGYGGSALAVAIFNDTLNFNIAGATNSTVTNIGVSFTIDGSLTATGPYSGSFVIGDLRFGNAYGTAAWSINQFVDSLSQGGWVSGSWAANSSSGQSTFTGVYALTGASQTLGIRSALTSYAGTTASSNYFNTSTFLLDLPSSVSFTSNSGTFLSALQQSGGVPEPATWALMLLGFGFVGAAMRHRPKVAVTYA